MFLEIIRGFIGFKVFPEMSISGDFKGFQMILKSFVGNSRDFEEF